MVDLLLIPVHLKGEGKMLFILDTGAQMTVLDDALAQRLGKQIGSEKIISMYAEEPTYYYRAPELYVGGVRLRTGRRIVSWDMSRLSADLGRFNGSNHQLMGILGMDCLQHYCVQLDFLERKIRFLAPEALHLESLGQEFAMIPDSRGRPTVDEEVAGVQGALIDTGCIGMGGTNVLGLEFLARHLVTFNFPEHTMYLKPQGVGSTTDESVNVQPNQGAAHEPPPAAAVRESSETMHTDPDGQSPAASGGR